jgi:2-methylisocitrate lyase-like PEP mutase family enzyme
MATFRDALKGQCPLILPCAHDALTARLIEQSGAYLAYQVGGFALDAAADALPDVGLRGFDAQYAAVSHIIRASGLPLLVDADTGYGDVKMVTHVVREYERLGVSAIFIEDQQPPKKCGHMNNKQVVPIREMCDKLKAAMAAKRSADFLIIGRTDAIEPEGVDEAIRRALWYADICDGAYVEGIRSREEAQQIGNALSRVPIVATSILEGGGKTPFLSHDEWRTLGFTALLYPTTVLFQAASATRGALARLSHGQPMPEAAGFSLQEMEGVLSLQDWSRIEQTFNSTVGAGGGGDAIPIGQAAEVHVRESSEDRKAVG